MGYGRAALRALAPAPGWAELGRKWLPLLGCLLDQARKRFREKR